jgi:hypothetical protein
MKKIHSFTYIILGFILLSCDGGLSPEAETTVKPGFSGKIVFKGKWPGNVESTYIVLFKNALNSAEDFNAVNLKYVSTLIPKGTDEFEFNTLEDISFGSISSGRYAYLAVAQSSSPILTLLRSAWSVTGVYRDAQNDYPEGTIVIPENKFVENIIITCDFDNPPNQPPGQ